jgi:hypothetical protein
MYDWDWRKDFDSTFRYHADKSRKENCGMAKGVLEFKVTGADNGFIVESGGRSMVAKTVQEIGEAVMEIVKLAGKAKEAKPKAPRSRRTKEQIALDKAAKAAGGEK